tara:strand:- start:16556 stop:17152 length:597 start_codon:yes stop_codon:yes gene_type:complete
LTSNFHQYISEQAIDGVQLLINEHNINLKIVNQRQTKHGDFRKLPNGKFQITINNNLNPYQFLLTLIHEIAHHVTFQKYGRTRPHGIEWKQTFQHLMLPFLNPEIYPSQILAPLAHYLKNPKASTDSDVKLSLALKENKSETGKSFIFDVPLNAVFIFKNKQYKRGNKRKTRYECLQLDTKRLYLFNQNAEVIIYEGR